MKIINRTRQTILAEEVVVADTLFKRMRGLLARKAFKKGEALIIRPCNSIHTFFMPFAIDVLFVDREHKVIKAISCLLPFRLSGVYFKAALVIELPAGTIQSTSTSPDDILSIA